MDEFALRGRAVRSFGEDADAIADARPAQFRDRQSDVDRLRKGERRGIGAARLDDRAIGSPLAMSSMPCSTIHAFTALSNHS